MNRILTCELIVSRVNARTYFVPILAFVLVTVFLLIDYNLAILNLVRLFAIINIIKSRFALFDIGDPRSHMFGIHSERMVYVILVYLTELCQRLQITDYLS